MTKNSNHEKIEKKEPKEGTKDKEKKRKTIKHNKRGKIRETEKDTERNASSQGDSKIPEAGRFVNPKATFSKAGSRNCTEKERGTKVTEYSNLSTTRSRGSLLGKNIGTGKYMCHSCKTSDHNAKRHSVGMENQRTFLNKVEIVKEKIGSQSSLTNILDIVLYYHLIVFVLNNKILV